MIDREGSNAGGPSSRVDMTDLCDMTAVELRNLLVAKEVSAVEVTRAHLDRIEQLNPVVNALVTLTEDIALRRAAEADSAIVRGRPLGPLHGLPVAHKDLQDTAGVRTTYGSLAYKDHVPLRDSLLVTRMRDAGAIMLGKTNTPEFGTGSQTYNEVFGATLNPFDTTRTAGGSSGGAAAALATGMVALADGSDMGGSLRNPASFCNVVGLRPSAGRVPAWPNRAGWFTLSVDGPMARTVGDVALLLSVVAGHSRLSPIALPGTGAEFADDLGGDLGGVRVAWSRNLGGLTVDPVVTEIVDDAGRATFQDLGCQVVDLEPDLSGAEEAFRIWRAWFYDLMHGDDVDNHRAVLNPDVIANVELGRSVTSADLARAEVLRTRLWESTVELMSTVDVLVAPTVQVPPFPASERWVTEIAGEPQHSYLDWMRSAYWISSTGLPAISVPCGFTSDGLPIGLQIVGQPHGERRLLEIAYAFEQANGSGQRRPPLLDSLRNRNHEPPQVTRLQSAHTNHLETEGR